MLCELAQTTSHKQHEGREGPSFSNPKAAIELMKFYGARIAHRSRDGHAYTGVTITSLFEGVKAGVDMGPV